MTALALVPDAAEAAELFTGEVHPYADRWPMRTDDELESMAASINARGQRFPCVLTPSGVLVDGRNRLAACDLADVPPAFVVDESLTDEDAIVAYIWDVNGVRRNDMSKGQLAMLAALMPGSTRVLSTQLDVTNGYINRARQVIQWCDEAVIAAVIDGTTALNDAYAKAQENKATEQAEEIQRRKLEAEAKKRAEAEAAQLADLRATDPDLAGLVDEKRMTLPEAVAAYRERTRKERERAAAIAEAIRQANVSVTEAIYRLHLLNLHPDGVADWLANYDHSQPIHPLAKAELSHAIAALTRLEAAL